jgi:hypothetical protein
MYPTEKRAMTKDFTKVQVRMMEFEGTEPVPEYFATLTSLFAHWHETGEGLWKEAGEVDRMIQQTLICVSLKHRRVYLIICPWEDKRERRAVMSVLSTCLHEYECDFYAFFSEAWFRSAPKVYGGVKAEDDDTKQDGFFTLGVDKEGNRLHCAIVRTRDADNRWSYQEQDHSKAESVGGELAELFDTRFIDRQPIFKVSDAEVGEFTDEQLAEKLWEAGYGPNPHS